MQIKFNEGTLLLRNAPDGIPYAEWDDRLDEYRHTPPLSTSGVSLLRHTCIAGNQKHFKRPRVGKKNTQAAPLLHSHMGTVYHRYPFCDHVFEIGPADYRPMKRHIRVEHTEPDDGSNRRSTSSPPVAPRVSL